MVNPSAVFDLTRWYLTLPVADPATGTAKNVYQPALATFSDSNYFYAPSATSVVFKAPAKGATTSTASGSTRSELREMLDASGQDAKANWGWGDGRWHVMTITETCDPTSVVGRKEATVAQVHDTGGTPPIRLAINMNSLPGTLSIFKNGPSDGTLLTGLQPSTVYSARIEVNPVTKKVNIYACLGDSSNLGQPKKTYPLSDFSAQDQGCYFKAGVYNLEQISDASTGTSTVTMTRLDLVNSTTAPSSSGGTTTGGTTGGGTTTGSGTTTALPHPAALLHIGPNPSSTVGWNHYNVGGPLHGTGAQTDHGQSELQTFEDTPWCYSKVDADSDQVVEFSAPIAGATTSGSSNPRYELRELEQDGVTLKAFDPMIGDNWIEGIYRFTGLPPAKPECSALQAHSGTGSPLGSNDTVMILTKARSGGGQDLILKAQFTGQSNSAQVATLLADYQLGTKFYAKIRIYNGGDLAVYFTTNLANIPTTPVYTKSQAWTQSPDDTWYLKTGAYVQANPTTDPSDDQHAPLARLQVQQLKTFHTGDPTPAIYTGYSSGPGSVNVGGTGSGTTTGTGTGTTTGTGTSTGSGSTVTPTALTGVPWTKTFRDGTPYPVITGGDGGASGIANSISALQNVSPNSVVTYTGSGLTGANVITGMSNVTYKGLKLLPGATLVFKNCSNLRNQVEMKYQQAGDIVQVDGTFNYIEFFDCVFGPDTEGPPGFTTTCQFLAIGDSGSAGSSFSKITRCTFQNKSSGGNAYRQYGDVANPTGGTRYSVASQCLFKNIRPYDENDHEPIRLGVSTEQLTVGHHIVEFSLFDTCQAEPEVVSMKMNYATVRGNTFVNCAGGPSLRHGDDGEISHNYFVGDVALTSSTGAPVSSAGVRGYGRRHNIHHNTIRVNGTANYQRPILMDYGDTAPGTTSNGHAYLQDWKVAHNLLVKCGDGIVVGKNYDTAPTGCTVSDNVLAECAQVDATGVRAHNGASLAGLTIANNTVFNTVGAAGLTQGVNGEWLAPSTVDAGSDVPFLTAAMVGQGSAYDPWAGGSSAGATTPTGSTGSTGSGSTGSTGTTTASGSTGSTGSTGSGTTTTGGVTYTPPVAPSGSAYSTVTPFFAGSQLTSPEIRWGMSAAFARGPGASLVAEAGVIPGGGNTAFTPTVISGGSSPKVSVAPGQAVVSRASGTYIGTLPMPVLIDLPLPLPPSGQNRIDILVAEVIDPEADTGTTRGTMFQLRVIPGVPGTSASTGSVPNGAVALFGWRTDNNGNIAQITSFRSWTRAAGGVRPLDAEDGLMGSYPGDLRIFPTGQLDAWLNAAWITVVSPAVWTEIDSPWTYSGTGAGDGGTTNFGNGSTAKCRYKRIGNDLTLSYAALFGTAPFMGAGPVSTVLPNNWTTPTGRDQWIPCHIWVKDAIVTDVAGMALIVGGSNVITPFFPDFYPGMHAYRVAAAPGVPGHSVPVVPNGYAQGGSIHIGPGLIELNPS